MYDLMFLCFFLEKCRASPGVSDSSSVLSSWVVVVSVYSESCQRSRWFNGHKEKCDELRLSSKSSLQRRRNSASVALVPCRRNDWCSLCELQCSVERVSLSTIVSMLLSPITSLSRFANIGGSLGYGKQEDAHKFMRFAIDTMQSVCLDEYGGEKAVHPSSQETTLIEHTALIQHIFGGRLQSQVDLY
ncbi:ubiquitin carboxyl-terminal hydrolase 18-like protein [Tanacetum coccineum]|uniref:Ubiquitin carboxyl-terminal hydrolase 18-like protein n=1 Tax=Tanacetum coccineum TaxID=301880 RepID=A0ABQ5GNL1_9ASTR